MKPILGSHSPRAENAAILTLMFSLRSIIAQLVLQLQTTCCDSKNGSLTIKTLLNEPLLSEKKITHPSVAWEWSRLAAEPLHCMHTCMTVRTQTSKLGAAIYQS